jgi:hypothetical protein
LIRGHYTGVSSLKYRCLIQKATLTRPMSAGTSMSGPTTPTKASPDFSPKTATDTGSISSEIERQAAGQVRQNIKDSNWLFTASVFLLGVIGGLLFGYFFIIRTQNTMDDRLDRIEQFLSAPAQPVPAAPDPHTPTHRGKTK